VRIPLSNEVYFCTLGMQPYYTGIWTACLHLQPLKPDCGVRPLGGGVVYLSVNFLKPSVQDASIQRLILTVHHSEERVTVLAAK